MRREVASACRSRGTRAPRTPRLRTSSSPGVPIGWTVSDSPSATTRPCSSPEPRGDGRRDEEQHEPGVGEQRRELHPAVAVAVEVRRAVGDLAADDEPVAAQDRGDVVGAATPAISARSGSVGSKNGSGWTTRMSARLAPQPRGPVERAGDDREDQHDEPDAEPGRAEHVEQLEPLERVHDARRRAPGRTARGAVAISFA